MAHEIDFSTGAPAIAYVGKAPSHGYGEKIEVDQPIEAWLIAARLGWELKKLPVQYIVSSGELKAMDNSTCENLAEIVSHSISFPGPLPLSLGLLEDLSQRIFRPRSHNSPWLSKAFKRPEERRRT
jgi:hypothetical protein